MKKTAYTEAEKLNLKVIISLARSKSFINKRESLVFNKYGLTTPQFGVLEFLYHKGANRIKTIIEKTLSTGGNMTVIIDNLEKCGLIKRLPDPEDRRALIITTTEKGKELIQKVFTEHLSNLDKMFETLSKDEKKDLIKFHKKIGRQE